MPSPSKSRDHTARLQAQIAELQAQREELMHSLLPHIPAQVLESSTTTRSTSANANATTAANSGNPTEDSTASQTSTTEPEGSVLSEQTQKAILSHAQAAVKQHIARLQAYNEIRDIGQGLMGMIAEQRGLRIKQVMEEMGVGEGD